jgi:outer membrane phospholipase A
MQVAHYRTCANFFMHSYKSIRLPTPREPSDPSFAVREKLQPFPVSMNLQKKVSLAMQSHPMKRFVRRARAFASSGAGLSVLLSILLLASVGSVRAQDVTAVFTAPSGTLTVGSRASLWLYCMNNSSHSVRRTFEPSLKCTLSSQSVTLETELQLNTNSSPSTATIPPGGFVKEEYLLDLPLTSSGQVTLDISSYNQLMVLVEPSSSEAPLVASAPVALPSTSNSTTAATAPPNSDLRDYFINHVSFYEPIYFIAGSSPSVEFQFSLKYKVFNIKDDWDPLTHLYFAYTQTSFWNAFSPNPSFFDTSYKPSMFLYYPDVFQNGLFQLDLQGGAEHESNGQGGTEERSFNTFYFQPKATFDLPAHFQFSLQPRAWFYYRVGDNNSNIADFHGYADLISALTWLDPHSGEKIQLSNKFLIGDDGSHVGLLFDLRFNLGGLPVLRKFNPAIQVQYFYGYGQNLLDYNVNTHALRAGLCLYY